MLQDLAETENGIERGAQFVAHAREKFAFGKVGTIRFGFGRLKRFFGVLEFRNIAAFRDEILDLILAIAHRNQTEIDHPLSRRKQRFFLRN